ncbi:MAG TPA: zinc-dependent metalloprotease [Puia sp.]|jgi:hypothetical protein
MKIPLLCLILTCFALVLFQHSYAQAICGFDIMHARQMKEDPTYRKNVLTNEASIRDYIRQHPSQGTARPIITAASPAIPSTATTRNLPTTSGNPATTGTPATTGSGSSAPVTLGALYTIPVVVHVMHTGGAVGTIYNPTDAQILGAIAYLNAVYNGTYPGTAGAGDLGIQFVLAQRDPGCNPTNGIIRVDASGVTNYTTGGVNSQTTLGTNDLNIKNLSRWDPTQYYNIWIVDKIDGNDGTSGQFIAGYAYFPGVSATEDGIVMLATQMQTGQKTLPHEIGHAFNLYHPFEGSTDASVCPPNTNCSMQGDQVCDTDPISENINSVTGVIDFTCRTGATNPCNSSPYTDATESNYMNYTFCYTEFTPGQRTRMQGSAAMSPRLSLSTSLGGTPPSAGCAPYIDFELDGDQQTETTAATTGCRSYKDYSYNMLIGTAPSAAATATLNVASGAAVQGVDFDITTNGNFTTPSLQLSFPAGSAASQPFTIRVYDDGSVNGSRSVTLGYTVNNGGGNAAAGTGRPNFKMIINDNDRAPTGGTLPTATVPVGGSLAYAYNQLPFDATQPSARSEYLYKPSELTAAGITAGPISGLALYVYQKLSSRAYTNMYIKLGQASVPYLVNGLNSYAGSSMTVVSTLSTYNTIAGWNNFTFDTPYIWDGTSGLVLEICYDNGTSAPADNGDAVGYYSDGGAANQGSAYVQDAINCWENFSSVIYLPNGRKPMLQLTYGIPPTTVQTALNTSVSNSQYLGPNTDVYFYDQTTNQLMARIRNGSSFDYGCTQVVVDRAGTNATQFWNTNVPNYLMDKTFHVLPTTNNPSGNYNITLYYTQAEVAGWQSFTGQTIGSAQIVKVPTQISNVTAANPSGGGTVTLATPSITTMGTNTGLTASFTNGFSGFGVGVTGLNPLPVGLLNFDGQLQGNDALLTWTTSFEQGSKGFEIDRSADGISFSKIGYVAAAGNSTSPRNYSFTDPALSQDMNYYRLKQIDLDDAATYSKTILVRRTGASDPGFTVLSNPFTDNLDIVFGQIPPGNVQIRLMDMAGRELLRQTGTGSAGSRLHIGLSGASLSAGVYLLEVRFNNQTQVVKVIKK